MSQTEIAEQRVLNFSAGPAVLPETVLRQIAEEMIALPGVGSSILEVSHRGKAFTKYINAARDGLRELLSIPDEYEIMFLQGGSRLQFAMIPMNFMHEEKCAAYAVTGSWGKQAFQEAAKQGNAKTIWDGSEDHFTKTPNESFQLTAENYSYFYYVSNETIQGVQFSSEPDCGDVPMICDASSDFLHKPLAIEKYDLIYACAQKNAGPAGLTMVIAKRSLLQSGKSNLPGYLDYRSHADNESLFNTPPTFAIYVLSLIVDWLKNEIGGLEKMHLQNQKKAKMLYDVIDKYRSVYIGHADPDCRSLMNIVFKFPSVELQSRFLSDAEAAGFHGLAGHRSVGGIRASIYNAMPVKGVEALAEYMTDFAAENG